MGGRRTYYDLLRVAPGAEPEVIAAAYRALMSSLRKHPDLGGDEEEAILINRAYETLSSPVERRIYDAMLAEGAAGTIAAEARAAGTSTAERRRAPRHDVDATVAYCISHDVQWHPARVKDVSVLGLRMQSHTPLAVGQHLVIAPPNLATPAMHGTVRWARMFHPTIFERVYEAGVEFSDQIEDVDQRLAV